MSTSAVPNAKDLTALASKWNFGCLVRVKAQVMTRDEGTGMWVPLSGGGMSIVSLHRILAPRTGIEDDDAVYVILGQRIADKSMALNCELLNDLEYTSVNPTFHHWTTNGRRFGLTFQTSSDAVAFQKSILRLQQNMKWGSLSPKSCLNFTADEILQVLQQVSAQNTVGEFDESLSSLSLPHLPKTRDSSMLRPIDAPPRSSCITPRRDNAAALSAVQSAEDSFSSSSSAKLLPLSPLGNTSAVSGGLVPGALTLDDYGLYVDVSANSGMGETTSDTWLEGAKGDLGRKMGLLPVATDTVEELIYFSDSYVHFAKKSDPEKHDYCYPSLESIGTPYRTMQDLALHNTGNTGSEPSQIHFSTSVPVPLPIKLRRNWLNQKKKVSSKSNPMSRRSGQNSSPKLRCIYCNEYFTVDDNKRGTCRDAPDRVMACIKAATCVCCQEAVAYHCAGGKEEREDCDVSNSNSSRRRAMLVLICLVVPCLWCYLPLRACHWLGVTCGCCGPRHKSSS